jgi:GNAT superfamily N-acetyltransferase
MPTYLSAHDLKTIEIHQDDIHVKLRQIDLENLSDQDTQILRELSGDYEAIKTMFGKMIGSVFKTIHWLSPATVLEAYKEAYRKKKAQMPENQRIDHHYFVEDLTSGQFMANMTITAYVGQRPEAYKDKLLLEFGLLVHPHYRGQGLLSKLAFAGLQELTLHAPFLESDFCFSTRTDNVAIHKIAAKLGAELVDSAPKEVDFILFKQTIPTDFFILPREKI